MARSDGSGARIARPGPLERVPLFLVIAGGGAALMLLPAAYAGATEDYATGRPFLYGGILFFAIAVLAGLSAATGRRANSARGMLLSLVGAFAVLPVMLALPVMEAVRGLSFANAYLEMVSAITTTGFTVFDPVARAPDAVHLWRALVGWYGGFIIWVAAIAVLAPLRLGGFEVVLTTTEIGRNASLGRSAIARNPMRRVTRFARDLAPVYGILTLAAWIGLLLAGEDAFVALCHAMSVLATSGISPLNDLGTAESGRWGEAVLALFMVFAVSRAVFASDMPVPVGRFWYEDPELRLATAILVATPAVMIAHHFVSALEVGAVPPPGNAWRSLWGTVFMSLSFLTTGGFVSADWDIARTWSGLTTPGLILLGLAIIGGGVATTAGGVKLLRVYVLYRHGQFEVARLVHPSLVTGPGHRSRRFRLESAFVAWLYFMIFAMTIAGVMLSLALTGIDFEEALILTVAALTTTGPLAAVAGEAPIAVALLGPPAQAVLCVAMVLGRLETLALVALFNPEFWRA